VTLAAIGHRRPSSFMSENGEQCVAARLRLAWMSMPPQEVCDRARRTKDARFDGLFFTGVRSTRIFCRPVCPAPTPKPQNIVYFPTAAAASSAGFRPCLRCRPELSPGLRPADTTVRRALDLITDGYLQEASVEALASRVAVSPRHLRRLFMVKLGATPVQVHQTQRLLLAKQLLTESTLPVTQVALAAGFTSVRRFNDAFRACEGRPPSAVRRRPLPHSGEGLLLRLAYRPPLDFGAAIAELGRRAISRVEHVTADCYERTLSPGSGPRWIRITHAAQKPELILQAVGVRPSEIQGLVRQVRRMFDLDADMHSVIQTLAQDDALVESLASAPGLRLVGAWNGFEAAIAEVAGRAGAAELVERCGEPAVPTPSGLDRCFPSPDLLAGIDREDVRRLARAVMAGAIGFAQGQLLEDFIATCVAFSGMSALVAETVALRAMVSPDAFPVALPLLRAHSTKWRPWRAYALLHISLTGQTAFGKWSTSRTARPFVRPQKPEINPGDGDHYQV
jgi:AraC family transcriptional regulator of adaptative response / DNA-3-methyladenine glycosylase II